MGEVRFMATTKSGRRHEVEFWSRDETKAQRQHRERQEADAARAAAEVASWNDLHPPGTPVYVRRDDGSEHATRTESIAWNLCGTPVVRLEDGVPRGGYNLSRVRARTDDVR